jgi:hypothetical protein
MSIRLPSYKGYELVRHADGVISIWHSGIYSGVDVLSMERAEAIIDCWEEQENYEGACDSAAAVRLGD